MAPLSEGGLPETCESSQASSLPPCATLRHAHCGVLARDGGDEAGDDQEQEPPGYGQGEDGDYGREVERHPAQV